ncbi:MAG TPA: hypothetical protein VHH10_11415 [Rubrobacteraceae bacterium]|jgi:hypothetical protein|nr:hypothetical protein [Rubrobacteraceae bacterium]
MPIAADYSRPDLARVAAARRPQAWDEELDGLLLERFRVTVERLEE